MTCENCEKEQDLALNKNNPNSPPIAYVRIGVSNIAIIGCKKHIKELLKYFNTIQKEKQGGYKKINIDKRTALLQKIEKRELKAWENAVCIAHKKNHFNDSNYQGKGKR